MRELTKRSQAMGIDLFEVTDCLITHEHIDHIKGIKTLVKHTDIKVWAAERTFEAMGEVEQKNILTPHKPVVFGETKITPIPISHDAKSPLGFLVEDEKKKALVLTDTGKRPESIDKYLTDLDLVILEANHNPEMLQTGPYPFLLKKRIMSIYGHLSNQDSGAILADIVQKTIKPPLCFLAHLSEENNRPQIALLDVAQALKEKGVLPGRDISLQVASQYKPSKLISI